MHFDSFSELVAMAGHGPFVWSAYFVTLVVMLWLVLNPFWRRRQLRDALARGRRGSRYAREKPEEGVK